MAQPTHESVKLEPVPGVGFRFRLRCGNGVRPRFLIKHTDGDVVQSRADRMAGAAAALIASGHFAEAPLILRTAADAGTEKEFAATLAVAGQLQATGKRKPLPRPALTFRQVAEQWTSGKLHRDFPDHVKAKDYSQDASRLLKMFSLDVGGIALGELPMRDFTVDHAERVMRQLPESAKRPGARRQYGQTLHRVVVLAVYPLKLLSANPLPKGFVPKSGKPPAYPFLYPDEDGALMGAADAKVPLARRVLFGFLAREGCRISEAAALTFEDLDLAKGLIRLDENKTSDPRRWALDLDVVLALKAWKALRGAESADRVFVDEFDRPLPSESMADVLRADLKAAGVTRTELFTAGTNWQPLRVHDLRGTFVTLNLANGKTETWIADRTGHQSSQMINRYRRAARSAVEVGIGNVAPLHAAIPELAAQLQKMNAVMVPEGGPKGGPPRQSTLPHVQADSENPEESGGLASVVSPQVSLAQTTNPRVACSNQAGCARKYAGLRSS